MRRRSLLEFNRWMPLGRSVLCLALGAGILCMSAAASASLVITLTPWWLLGALLVVIGSFLQHLSCTPASHQLPTVTSTIDDLTIPLVRQADHAARAEMSDDLTIPQPAMPSRTSGRGR